MEARRGGKKEEEEGEREGGAKSVLMYSAATSHVLRMYARMRGSLAGWVTDMASVLMQRLSYPT